MRSPIETNTRPATISVWGANRSASRTTPMPAIIDTMAPGSVTSPAARGLSPSTSCRCCDMKKTKPIRPTMDRKFAITEELNGPYRNRPMSSIGVALRFWRRTNMNPCADPDHEREGDHGGQPVMRCGLDGPDERQHRHQ